VPGTRFDGQVQPPPTNPELPYQIVDNDDEAPDPVPDTEHPAAPCYPTRHHRPPNYYVQEL